MPQLFSKFHNDILKHYNETKETVVSNKEKSFMGKNKYGYLFPV